MDGLPMSHLKSLGVLDRDFFGVSNIIEIWFQNYKGPNKMLSRGFGGKRAVLDVLQVAIKAYAETVDNQ